MKIGGPRPGPFPVDDAPKAHPAAPAHRDLASRLGDPAPAHHLLGRTPLPRAPSPVAAAKPRARGPEAPASVGDVVRGPRIGLTPAEVVDAARTLAIRSTDDSGLMARLRRQPFPQKKADQLEWALAYAPHVDRLRDPLWSNANNDAAPALVAYVRGVLAGRRAGIPLGAKLDEDIAKAQRNVYERINANPMTYGKLESAPYPATRGQKLEWAIGVLTASWDPAAHPVVKSDPEARAMIDLVAGVLAKRANDETEVRVRSERRTLSVDGDTRVFAIHTPPGKRPAEGWPTVLFFHGSYGGYAPEQSADYQAINALADAQGFQVVYPVGVPQDRADLLRTGRGMLNWDPVGAGPGGANDRFVHALLKTIDLDPARVFAAGHSQGGFYVSNLIASYPGTFAGAAILGAGAGSVSTMMNHGALSRKTPVYLRTGERDIHRSMAESLAKTLDTAGWGPALRVETPPLRGHEVHEEDLAAVLAFFGEQPAVVGSDVGKIDGSTSEIPAGALPFLPSIDLASPPTALAADAKALATMKMLASHPLLDTDGQADVLTADEWRLALYYLDSFPEADRGPIADLRDYFVVTPPPADMLYDVARLPKAIAGDEQAMAALRYLGRTPALDLDGYPCVVSERELAAAEKYSAQLPAEVQAGVAKLRAHVPVVA